MITFLKKKGQDQTEAFLDLEEKLAAIVKVINRLTLSRLVSCRLF